jgi:hypothetical protein
MTMGSTSTPSPPSRLSSVVTTVVRIWRDVSLSKFVSWNISRKQIEIVQFLALIAFNIYKNKAA